MRNRIIPLTVLTSAVLVGGVATPALADSGPDAGVCQQPISEAFIAEIESIGGGLELNPTWEADEWYYSALPTGERRADRIAARHTMDMCFFGQPEGSGALLRSEIFTGLSAQEERALLRVTRDWERTTLEDGSVVVSMSEGIDGELRHVWVIDDGTWIRVLSTIGHAEELALELAPYYGD